MGDWLIGLSVWLLLLRGVRLLAARCPLPGCVAKSWVGIWPTGWLAGWLDSRLINRYPHGLAEQMKKWTDYLIFSSCVRCSCSVVCVMLRCLWHVKGAGIVCEGDVYSIVLLVGWTGWLAILDDYLAVSIAMRFCYFCSVVSIHASIYLACDNFMLSSPHICTSMPLKVLWKPHYRNGEQRSVSTK